MTNVFSMKKTVAVAAGLAIAFSAVFVSSANAQTAEELQAQIASLLAMIAGLQAQLGGDTGTTTPTTGGTCTATQFTLTHTVGDRGGEVMDIQKFLNANGFTVATSGAGSAGMETSYFGPATKAAVINFQNAYASEILAPVGLSAGTGYWGSSSRAKANAMEIAACASNNDDNSDDDTTPAGDNELTVSAAAQPGNSLAPKYAQGVAFTKFTLTAGDEDVMIDNIMVELTGLASRGAFDTVALLDEDGVIVGDTDSIDSDDEAKIGKNLKIKAGKSETFTVVANMDDTGSYAGEVAAISVTAINTDATVAGSLPITGAQHTVNSTLTVGWVEITDAGTTKTVNILDDKVKIGVLNIKAHDEDLNIESVRLNQTGDADLEDALDDLVAKFDGKTYDVEIDGDYLTVDLEGVLLEEGDNEDLTITATIVGGSDDTITFEVEEITDVVAVGADYGYGARVDDDNDATDNYTRETLATITIGKADVTISKTTDVDDEKVAAGSDMAELASFDVEAEGDDVTGDIDMIITATNGTGANILVGDIDNIELANVAIYTVDGDRISDREDFTWTAALNNAASAPITVTFKDVVFEAADDAIDYVIKGDINKDAGTGMVYTVTSIQYKSVETVDGDDVQTPNPVAVALGHAQTVEGSAIAVSIEDADDQDVNADQTDVVLAKIELDADNSGDDINVSEIRVKFVVADNSANGKTADNNDVRSCALYDGTTRVSDNEDSDATSVAYDVDIDVVKDEVKTLTVQCDLSDDFGDTDTIVVTGVDFNARGVVTTTDLDATFTTTTTATVTAGAPTAKLLASDDENDPKLVKDDANDVILAVYEYYSKNAETTIDDITVTFTGNVSTLIDGKVDVYIDGVKIDSETPTTTAAFTNLNTKVAKDDKVEVVFKADAKSGATGTIQIDNLTTFTNEEGSTVTVTNGTDPTVQIAASTPVLAQINTDTADLQTADDVALLAYTVTADGGDVTLANTVFETTNMTNVTIANATVKVFDSAPTNLDTDSTVFEGAAVLNGSSALVEDVDLSSVTVSENDTYYVYLIADITTSADTRSLRVKITDVAYAANTDGMLFGTPAVHGTLLMNGDFKALLKKD